MTDHPDVAALNHVHEVLSGKLDEQTTIDLINAIQNEGVVYRMARYRLDMYHAELRERLAAIEHERWADWQRWMHSRGLVSENGDLVIPRGLVEGWERQINTPYSELSEREKQSDREQVDRYWSLIEPLFKEAPAGFEHALRAALDDEMISSIAFERGDDDQYLATIAERPIWDDGWVKIDPSSYSGDAPASALAAAFEQGS